MKPGKHEQKRAIKGSSEIKCGKRRKAHCRILLDITVLMHRRKASRIYAQREATMTNLTPETRLRRKAVAEASTAHGFPIKEKTLATMASRGGGAPFQPWGPLPDFNCGRFFDCAPNRPTEPP